MGVWPQRHHATRSVCCVLGAILQASDNLSRVINTYKAVVEGQANGEVPDSEGTYGPFSCPRPFWLPPGLRRRGVSLTTKRMAPRLETLLLPLPRKPLLRPPGDAHRPCRCRQP